VSHPSPQPSGPETLREFSDVFDAEFSYVCRVLRRLGVREAELEDLAQEVFVTVHGKFPEYDRALPIRPWLFAFAFRVAGNHQRLARHRREVSVDADLAETDAGTTPEHTLADRQAQELVLRALDGVPLERRSVLIMQDIDGFSASEVANALSIPVNTVYSRLRIAREEFKAALKREQLKRGEA
jgi:RNA polymerase sigma-70 factor (ECF subfamily)